MSDLRPPRWTLRQGPFDHCAIVAFENWVPSPPSRPFAWSGKGRVDGAIRCRQLQPIAVRRTSETDAFLSVEDANSLQISLNAVLRGLAHQVIPARTAALMLYGLQISSSNLRRTREPLPPLDTVSTDAPPPLRSIKE